MRRLLLNLMRCQSGATLMEYAALLALVAAIATAFIDPFGRTANDGMASTTQTIDRAWRNAVKGQPSKSRGPSVAVENGQPDDLERRYPPAAGVKD